MPPTISEMSKDLEMGRGTAQWYINELERRGHLRRGRGGRIALTQGEPVPIFEIPEEIEGDTGLESDRHLVEYMPELVATEWAPEAEIFVRIATPDKHARAPGLGRGHVVAVQRGTDPERGRMAMVRIGTRITFRVFVEQDAKRVVLARLTRKGRAGKREEFDRSETDVRIEGIVLHMLARIDIAKLDYLEDNKG